jgi:hypothetical protein
MSNVVAALLWALTTVATVDAADPEGGLILAAGERVEVRIEAEREVTPIARGEAGPLSEFEQAAVQIMTGGTYKFPTGDNLAMVNSSELGIPKPAPVAAGFVRIRFTPIKNGAESLLILENGYDMALTYRARIHQGSRSKAADVCQVMPAKRGFEHWPYPIERIELFAIRLEPWQQGQRPRCE